MVAMWMIEQERHVASLSHPYGWIITRDRAFEIAEATRAAGREPAHTDDSQVGVIGPSSVPDDMVERLEAGEGVEFRLVDEGDLDADEDEPGTVREDHPDWSVVYEGRLIDPEDIWYHGPLNDFGAYMAIGIQYRDEKTGQWRDL